MLFALLMGLLPYQLPSYDAADFIVESTDCVARARYGGQNPVLCDVSPALRLALAECEADLSNWVGDVDIPCEIEVPRGLWYMASEVTVCNTVSIDFNGSKVFSQADVTPIRFLGFQACKDAGRRTAGVSSLSNLYLRPYTASSTVTLEAGIEIHAPVRLSNIKMFDYDIGVEITANATDTVVNRRANANGWRMDSVTVQRSNFRGIYVDGPDVNVGVATRVGATSSCRKASALVAEGQCADIFDGSFLGCTWIASSTGYAQDIVTSSVFPGFVLGDSANSRSVCLGCYIEGGYGGGIAAGTTNVLGGIGSWTGGGNRLEGNRISGLEAIGQDGLISVKLGSLTGGGALTLTPLGDSGAYPLRFKYSAANASFFADIGNLGIGQVLRIGAKNTTPTLGLGGLMLRPNNTLPNVYLNTTGYIVPRQVP